MGCGDESAASSDIDLADVVAEDGSASGSGHAVLTLVAPTGHPGLWPLVAGSRLRIDRLVGAAAPTNLLDADAPQSTLRVAPDPAQATAFRAEVVTADGVVAARGRSVEVLLAPDDPDRPLTVFLLPPRAIVPMTDALGVSVAVTGRLGGTVTSMSDGGIVLAGGAAYAGGPPCSRQAVGSALSSVDRIDVANHKVSELGPLLEARSLHAAVATSATRLVLLGGRGATGDALASVEWLRTNDGSVSAAKFALSVPRERPCAVRAGDRIVVAGGEGSSGGTVELWDPGAGPIATTGLSSPRSQPACAAMTDPVDGSTLVFVVGGDGKPMPGVAEVIRVAGDQLVWEGTVALATTATARGVVVAWPARQSLLLAGGFAGWDGAAPTATAWQFGLYGSATGPLPGLTAARGCAGGALIEGGHLVVAGGMGDSGEPLSIVDVLVLDPPAGAAATWQAKLSSPRADLGAVALPGGVVVFAGGVQLVAGLTATATDVSWSWAAGVEPP